MALTKPFAENGNKVAISLEKTDDGVVNYDEGFGARYEQPIKAEIDERGNVIATGGLQIKRTQFNGLMNELSTAIIENAEKSNRNFELIEILAQRLSGAAMLEKDNQFCGTANFSKLVTFKESETKSALIVSASIDSLSAESARFKTNPTIDNPLPFSACQDSTLITKENLVSQLPKQETTSAGVPIIPIYSAMAGNTIITKEVLDSKIEAELGNIDFSDLASLTKDNEFKGENAFKSNPSVINPLTYSAMGDNTLLTKQALETKLPTKEVVSAGASSVVYSAMAGDTILTKDSLEQKFKELDDAIKEASEQGGSTNVKFSSASFGVLRCQKLIVSSGVTFVPAITLSSGAEVTDSQITEIYHNLTNRINSNTSAIESNTEAILSNAGDIESNTAEIARHSTLLNGLRDSISEVLAGAETISGVAYLDKENNFTKSTQFKNQPTITNALSYEAIPNNALITKEDLESKISALGSSGGDNVTYSAMAGNTIITKEILETQTTQLTQVVENTKTEVITEVTQEIESAVSNLSNEFANTLSGVAFLEKDNDFQGVIKFNDRPSVDNITAYIDADDNTLIVKADLEARLENLDSGSGSAEIDTSNLATLSGNNVFAGNNQFNKQPNITEPLTYSAIGNNTLVTKEDLEKRVNKVENALEVSDEFVYSASAENMIITKHILDNRLQILEDMVMQMARFSNASFGTIQCNKIIVSSGVEYIRVIKNPLQPLPTKNYVNKIEFIVTSAYNVGFKGYGGANFSLLFYDVYTDSLLTIPAQNVTTTTATSGNVEFESFGKTYNATWAWNSAFKNDKVRPAKDFFNNSGFCTLQNGSTYLPATLTLTFDRHLNGYFAGISFRNTQEATQAAINYIRAVKVRFYFYKITEEYEEVIKSGMTTIIPPKNETPRRVLFAFTDKE